MAMYLYFVIRKGTKWSSVTFVSNHRRSRNDVIHFTSPFTSHIRHFTSSSPVGHFHDFVKAITVRADADRYIVLAMTDEGFVDMAINFYEASLRRYHVDNFLFVGVGIKSCKILTSMSIPCFHYADDANAREASDYKQENFYRKMKIRTDMTIDALEANFTVIHCDTDIAFFRNPVHQLKVK